MKKLMRTKEKENRTITITVELKGALRGRQMSGPGYLGAGKWRIPEGTKIGAVVELLALPKELSGIIFINGQRVQHDRTPQEGEVVAFFPPIGGG